MIPPFIAPHHLALLHQSQLRDFDQLWAYQGDWFEPPNQERGGWSGVNYLTLQAANNDAPQAYYLKRQQGFLRRTITHPLVGEPTFLREYNILRYLQAHNVSTPQLVFFAAKQQQAILMTEALTGYMAWDQWRKVHDDASVQRKKNVLAAIAKMVKRMHQVGVQHRSLYAKHIFVYEKMGEVNVAIIDFEKSRITPWIAWLKIADLMTLNYRTLELSRTQRLYFFKQYLGVTRLNAWQKKICCYIYQQALKKSSRKNKPSSY